MGIGARFNQNAFSLKGYSGFLYKNLKGTARAINSRLELQTRLNEVIYPEHKAFVSYFEPFLFDKDIRGQISIESSENIFEIARNQKSGDDSFYYLLKTEFRFPVYKDIGGYFLVERVGYTLFYDGGSVLIDGFELKDNYRHSAGIGIRYNTPIGAFTGEVGIKLDRDKS